MTNVVWFNGDLCDLAVLDVDSISLASVCAKHWGCWELEIPCACKGSICVAEESDAGGLIGVKGLAPSVHARRNY